MIKFQTKPMPSKIEFYPFPRILFALFWILVFGAWVLFVFCVLYFVILNKSVPFHTPRVQ